MADNSPLLGVAAPTRTSDCKLAASCHLSDGSKTAATDKAGVIRRLWIALVLCFIFMLVEIVGGYFAHSIAILSDAAHMLSDVASFGVSIFAAWIATQRSQGGAYTFGYHRAEIIGALCSVMVIFAVTGALVYEGVRRLFNPEEVDGRLMFFISLAGIAFNIVVGLVLGEAGHSHGPSDHSHSHGGGHDHGHSHGPAAPKKKTAAASPHTHGSGCAHGHGSGSGNGGEHDHGHDGHEHSHDHAAPNTAALFAAHTAVHIGESSSSGSSSGAATAAGVHDNHGHDHASHGAHGHGDGNDDGHGHGGGGSINLRSAVLHVLGDLVQSVGVALAGALIWWHKDDPRWLIADPICTLLFAVMVVYTTRSIVSEVINTLMESVPSTVDIVQLNDALAQLPGVADVHDLHVWNLSTGIPILTAHVHVDEAVDNNTVLQALEAVVRQKGITHSTIQICNANAL